MNADEAATLAERLFDTVPLGNGLNAEAVATQIVHLLSFASLEHGAKACSHVSHNADWLTVAAVRRAIEATAPPRRANPEHRIDERIAPPKRPEPSVDRTNELADYFARRGREQDDAWAQGMAEKLRKRTLGGPA